MSSTPPPTGDDRDELPPHGDEEAPRGGDEGTAEQLEADNPAEEDTLRALDPGAPSA
jgi:hypothetical protein